MTHTMHTAIIAAGAGVVVNGPEDLDWDAVDWRRAEDEVRRLRQRIFKASQAGDLKRVRNLQKLMLRSHANTLVSVRQVTERIAGRATAGIDGRLALTARDRMRLVEYLHQAAPGQVLPVKRVYIPKKGGKQRPLGIPVIADRAQQARVRNALEPEWEARFEPRSYGFRPGRSCHDAIVAVHQALNGPDCRRVWVLDADLASAFDKIDHSHLFDQLGWFAARAPIRQWLKAGIVDKGRYTPARRSARAGARCRSGQRPWWLEHPVHYLLVYGQPAPTRRPARGQRRDRRWHGPRRGHRAGDGEPVVVVVDVDLAGTGPGARHAAHLGAKRLATSAPSTATPGDAAASNCSPHCATAPAGTTDETLCEALRDAVIALVTVLKALGAAHKDINRSVVAHLGEHPDGEIFTSLPRSGQINAAQMLAEWGDCRQAYDGPEAIAALAGAAPVTNQSGKHHAVHFRWACNKRFRVAITTFADNSRHASPWAAQVYIDARPGPRPPPRHPGPGTRLDPRQLALAA